MKNTKSIQITLFVLVFIIILINAFFAFKLFGVIDSNFEKFLSYKAKEFLAGIFFVSSITETELKRDYAEAENNGDKIKILLVPGHNDENYGTYFRGAKEADLNAKLAKELFELFKKENEFEIFLTRDEIDYSQTFLDYFEKERENIEIFREENKNKMNNLVEAGLVESREWIVHNSASSEEVIRLYGINKWANENKIDIVIHVHFNDYPGRPYYLPGKYSGFSIYVPDGQFSNSNASIALAETILDQMKTYFAVSNLPKEKNGVIEDQNLIAIGAFNTLDSSVIFVEYGYIYESQFISPEISPIVLKEMALQTYQGIKNFFNDNSNENEEEIIENKKITATLPYKWGTNLKDGIKNDKDVFALQTALAIEGLYPPVYRDKNDCPINGNFGPCTEFSVKKFQELYEIEPAWGFVGPLTRTKLNELFSK